MTLPHDYTPPCPFSDKFFKDLESLGSYSPSKWENCLSDDDHNEVNERPKSPPPKRLVKITDQIENSDKSDSSDIMLTKDTPRRSHLVDITNKQKSGPIESLSSPSTSDPKYSAKRKRLTSKTVKKVFFHTPPWFLEVDMACFTCEKYMGKNAKTHRVHGPKNPLFPSAPMLDEENAKQWAILFDQLIGIVKTHFEASSSAHLLQILEKEVPQPARSLCWTDAQKYVLKVYHELFYDAVKVEDVVLSPPNSLKVLSDDSYFRKVMGASSLSFKRAVNRL